MLQKAATTNQPAGSSKKCFNCGLRNFADTNKCRRCKSDLSLPVNVAKSDKLPGNDGESVRSTFSSAWILGALVVVLLGVALYLRQRPQEATEVGGDAVVAQVPTSGDAKQPGQEAAEQNAQNAQSEAAAKEIVTELKRFQDITESGLEYDEYDKRLNSLKTDLNNTLPNFVRHNPSDETFRQEVAAAIRDYTAAGNWWKTTIRDSNVFTEADRNERTQRNWASARTHLTNAENVLAQ